MFNQANSKRMHDTRNNEEGPLPEVVSKWHTRPQEVVYRTRTTRTPHKRRGNAEETCVKKYKRRVTEASEARKITHHDKIKKNKKLNMYLMQWLTEICQLETLTDCFAGVKTMCNDWFKCVCVARWWQNQTHAVYTHRCIVAVPMTNTRSPHTTLSHRGRKGESNERATNSRRTCRLLHTELFLRLVAKKKKNGCRGFFVVVVVNNHEMRQTGEGGIRKKPFTWIWVQNRKTLIKISSLTVLYLWEPMEEDDRQKWGQTKEEKDERPEGFDRRWIQRPTRQ